MGQDPATVIAGA